MRALITIQLVLVAAAGVAICAGPTEPAPPQFKGLQASSESYWVLHLDVMTKFAASLAASGKYDRSNEVDIVDTAYRLTDRVFKKYDIQIVEPAPAGNVLPNGKLKNGPARDFFGHR